jgi:amino acid transporter
MTDKESSLPSDVEKSNGVVDVLSPGSVYVQNDNGEVLMANGLKAGLKNRMVNLIALCGIIGPGVFLGFGSMLVASGPAGMLVGFALVGIVVLICMFDIGELNAAYDANFAILGSRFVSKGFGAALSLAYVVLWITNLISEYTSLCAAMSVYTDKIPMYGWFLLLWAFFTCFQLLNVSWWGESEYVLGIMKLVYLTGFYLFAIIYAAGGIPDHKPDDPFGNYPLKSGFKGIANAFVFAGVFYSGVEGVSVIAAETRNPRKAIPTACKNTVFRIFYVYFGLTVAYGITVAYNDPAFSNAQKVMRSPMTIALTNAGWANSKYFVTSFILLTCISSINSAIYFASRALFTWAEAGYGPKILTKATKHGIPWVAIHGVHLTGFLSILSYKSGSSVAYGYIVNVAGVAAFIAWTGIIVTHYRFRTAWVAQGHALDKLPFVSKWFPYTDYVGFILGVLLVLVQGWSVFKPFDYKGFIDSYIMLPVFFICWFCYDKFYFKEGFIKAHEIDFTAGRRPDLDDNVGCDIDEI